MQRDHCPNCNSSYVVPDGRKYGGEPVLYCTECTSWFLDNGTTILFQSDGGDDIPDGEYQYKYGADF